MLPPSFQSSHIYDLMTYCLFFHLRSGSHVSYLKHSSDHFHLCWLHILLSSFLLSFFCYCEYPILLSSGGARLLIIVLLFFHLPRRGIGIKKSVLRNRVWVRVGKKEYTRVDLFSSFLFLYCFSGHGQWGLLGLRIILLERISLTASVQVH